MIGHTLRVIAGRHRDHPAPALVGRQRAQAIERTALLEGRGELQVLEFQPEPAAANLAERAALAAHRCNDRTMDRGRGGPDVRQRNRQAAGICRLGRPG